MVEETWGLLVVKIYGQVLNPFIFGGELVKSGINPDDTTGWSGKKQNDTNFIGGQTNNTILTRSYVIGLRLGFDKPLKDIEYETEKNIC